MKSECLLSTVLRIAVEEERDPADSARKESVVLL